MSLEVNIFDTAKSVNQLQDGIKEESKCIYEMLFKTIRCHIYTINVSKKEVIHRGNIFEWIEFKESYTGMIPIFPMERVDLIGYEAIGNLHKLLLTGVKQSAQIDFEMKLVNQVHYRWYQLQIQFLKDDDSDEYKIIGFITDIDERKKKELALKEAVFIDGLTGLYNKVYFEKYVTEKIAGVTKGEGYLVVLDMDNFKRINDEKGHGLADELLRRMGAVLNETIRLADEESIAARFGGDEFVMWLQSPIDLEYIIKNIIKYANDKRPDDAKSMVVGVSIGVAAWKENMCYEELFKIADKAMYCAKKEGKNNYKIMY